MKTALYSLTLSASFILPVRADLTIVYASTVRPASQTPKHQAAEPTRAATSRPSKIKRERASRDTAAQVTTIVDGQPDDGRRPIQECPPFAIFPGCRSVHA